MKYLLLIALVWLTPCNSIADDEIRIAYGLGTEEALMPDARVKTISLAWRRGLSDVFSMKTEAGVFSDTRLKYPFTVYWALQFGTQVKPSEWFYIENYFGPGGISQISERLGSNFQFFLDLGVGFREPNTKTTLGMGYQHISNAGIVQPNIGQNMMRVQLGIPL